jgi:hypothetical protein
VAAIGKVLEVQALLGSDEALVLLFDTPEFKPTVAEGTFIWVQNTCGCPSIILGTFRDRRRGCRAEINRSPVTHVWRIGTTTVFRLATSLYAVDRFAGKSPAVVPYKI